MCTVVLLRRPAHAWPLLVAANRDEMVDRPARAPARHWPDRPDVTAGIDELAGGTWLGVNDHGVMAAIMNRPGSLGPAEGVRSRGELPLEALDHADAREAAKALAAIEARSYRAFNLVIADDRQAFWLRGLGRSGDGRVAVQAIPDGLSMLTAYDLNDHASPRIAAYLPRFERVATPNPDTGDWTAWKQLLGARRPATGFGPEEAMTIETERGFGTVSSSLLAFPSRSRAIAPPIWLFADGPPDRVEFVPVEGLAGSPAVGSGPITRH
jgi:uncharacterized protein with NRDE domain